MILVTKILKKILAENEILIPALNLELQQKCLNDITETNFYITSTSYYRKYSFCLQCSERICHATRKAWNNLYVWHLLSSYIQRLTQIVN
jgi:hypothetical protein